MADTCYLAQADIQLLQCFYESASPNAVSLWIGNTATSSISVTPYNGFDSTVTLTVSSITDAYGNVPPGLTASLATASTTVSTTNSPSTWTDTLTIAAASGAGSTQAPPGGTYYVTVQAAGGGYTDSVIVEVTVTAPNVAVTYSPIGSVFQVGASLNVSASADATCGSLSLSSVTISGNGTSIGTIDYPLTEGEPTTFTWAVVEGPNVFTATAARLSAGKLSRKIEALGRNFTKQTAMTSGHGLP